MEIIQEDIITNGIKLLARQEDKIVGRAFLYIIKNDLRQETYGFLEDLFVEEEYRGQGFGKQLILEVIETAKKNNCYKLLATSRHSRPEIHQLYEKFGFKNWGLEFRMDF